MIRNIDKFSGRVDAYARHRAGYPAEALLGWLRHQCGLEPGWRIADVAAGTGMLSEVLLGNGNEVTAVEPNAEMRTALEPLAARYAGLRVQEGTAESTGLATGSVEMVTAGRAFHWFEPEAAAAEFRRVLAPRGWVVLVSSGPKHAPREQAREFERIELEHGTDPEHVRGRERRGEQVRTWLEGLSGPGAVLHVQFAMERWLDLPDFLGAVQSTSVAPLPGDDRHAGMEAALKMFFARWSKGDRLRVDEETTVDAVRVAEPPPGGTANCREDE